MAEKAASTKSKNRFLKFLPKAAAAPFSPNKEKISADKSQKSHMAPTKSIVPADALRSKSRNPSFGAREPTSPKVSCMGQVKRKKKLCSYINNNNNYVLPPLDHLNLMVHNSKVVQSAGLEGDVKRKKKPLAIKNMFSRVPSGRRKSDAIATTDNYVVGDHRASSSSSSCSLSQMRRFSSSRTSLSNFDWTVAQIAPVDNEGENGCRDKVKISSMCAAPRIIQECKEVSFEPRKEINLWKRRPMAQPRPLQL